MIDHHLFWLPSCKYRDESRNFPLMKWTQNSELKYTIPGISLWFKVECFKFQSIGEVQKVRWFKWSVNSNQSNVLLSFLNLELAHSTLQSQAPPLIHLQGRASSRQIFLHFSGSQDDKRMDWLLMTSVSRYLFKIQNQ